jgi:hypothetical protein
MITRATLMLSGLWLLFWGVVIACGVRNWEPTTVYGKYTIVSGDGGRSLFDVIEPSAIIGLAPILLIPVVLWVLKGKK